VILRLEVPAAMSAEDAELLAISQDLLEKVYQHGRHEVATALRTADGAIHTGVHVEGSCRRSSICAEGVAMGTVLASGSALEIQAVVSVQIKPADRFRIIAPCGVCRELISDYAPDATVWLTAGEELAAYKALDLLPEKSRRVW
jgi:cytidine deaminase